MSDDVSSSPKPSTFLTLPAELKDHIFSYILKLDRPIIYNKSFKPKLTRTFFYGLLKIFLVCKKLHEDASRYFYRQNIFQFDLRASNLPNTHTVKDSYIRHMRHIDLLIPERPDGSWKVEIIIRPKAIQLWAGQHTWQLEDGELVHIEGSHLTGRRARCVAEEITELMVDLEGLIEDEVGLDVDTLRRIASEVSMVMRNAPR